MKKENQSFAQLLEPFRYHYTLRTVFEDFLTMSLCAVTQHPLKGKSHYEDLYMQTIEPYKTDELRHQFPKAFASLVAEMEDRKGSGQGNDVLGEYYEQSFSQGKLGQFFTPWPVCQFMARCTITPEEEPERPLRVIDAPIGYLNTRDHDDKPLLVVDEEKAFAIRRIYEMYLQGLPIKAIHRYAADHSFPLKGHSAIMRVLTNPVYAGLVKVNAYKKEPEKIKPGIHHALIAESDYWEVQQRLGLINVPRAILNENVPLRGVLKCDCGKIMTAGNSKGKKKYYWYYKCCEHSKQNYSAIKLHDQFDELLANLSLDDKQLNYLLHSAERQMREETKAKTERLEFAQKEYRLVTDKLDSLEEKYINNAIAQETYSKWYGKLKTNESALKHEIDVLQEKGGKYWQLFQEQLPKLSHIGYVYNMGSIAQKQSFVRQVFNSELRYADGVYRTPYLLELFQPKAALLKEKRLLVYEKPLQKWEKIPVVPSTGNSLNT